MGVGPTERKGEIRRAEGEEGRRVEKEGKIMNRVRKLEGKLSRRRNVKIRRTT